MIQPQIDSLELKQRDCAPTAALIPSESMELWKFSIFTIDLEPFSYCRVQTCVVYSFDTGINKIHLSLLSSEAHFFLRSLLFQAVLESMCYMMQEKANKKKTYLRKNFSWESNTV